MFTRSLRKIVAVAVIAAAPLALFATDAMACSSYYGHQYSYSYSYNYGGGYGY